MGWKPSNDFPKIMEYLGKKGYMNEVSLTVLRLAVIDNLGYLTDKPLQNIIRLLEDYGYIQQTKFVNIWKIIQKDTIEQEATEIDKIIEKNIKGKPIPMDG